MASHHPSSPALPQPLPIDLIVAARDVVDAFGGNVPDWLQDEIGALESALQPFDAVSRPKPVQLPLGAKQYRRKLDQRTGIFVQTLLAGLYEPLECVFVDDGSLDDDAAEKVIVDALAKYDLALDDLSAVATITVDQEGIQELWATEGHPHDEDTEFTLVWRAN